jgi:peptidyl-prolyl cis-trans isomerase B (cyclophilin B)
MKNKSSILLAFSILLFTASCQTSKDSVVIFHTQYGDMTAILYEETPKHKANFIELVKSGKYDSTIFHRVIENFMVQGGDVNQKDGIEEEEKINYTIEEEIHPDFWHVKGALAAARQGDNVNPKRKSSGSQFYIIHGQKFTENDLVQMAEGRVYQQKQMKLRECLAMKKYAPIRNQVIEMQKAKDMEGLQNFMETTADSLVEQEFGKQEVYEFSEEQIKDYETVGGAPHLDGEYTVFGRVVEGMNVIDSIASVRTAAADKPVKDIFLTAEIEKMSRKKITEQYGYEYPKEDK